MDSVLLDNVSSRLSREDLRRRLHIAEGSSHAAELDDLVAQAEAIGRPKALSGVAYIDARGDDFVIIDGVRFKSRVLAVNLQETHRVFPFLATCGQELEQWARGLEDILQSFWSEAIREAAMRNAVTAIGAHLEATYRPGNVSRMSPGSLADWPIEEQLPLFSLFGDTEARVGVRLTESLLMVPSKTVSGLRFGKAGNFESCMLCPRHDCPNRRAPHDPALYEERYRRNTV